MALDSAGKTDGLAINTALDRRRAGRRADVSPELIPLLRTKDDGFLSPEDLDDRDPLSASRGIIGASLISGMAWILVGLAVWIF